MSWLKLHREIQEHPVFDDPDLLQIFLWCLISANITSAKWKGITLEAGQFIAGRNSDSKRFNIPPSTWLRRMEKLQKLGCISLKPDNQWTVVTVVNWNTYNGIDSKTEENRTTNEQQTDSERTGSETTSGQQTDTDKEINNSITQESISLLGANEKPKDPTNGKTFLTGLSESAEFSREFREFWKLVPEDLSCSVDSCWIAWDEAVAVLAERTQCDPEVAAGMLVTIWGTYVKSVKAKASNAFGPKTFLLERRFFDNPKSWNRRERVSVKSASIQNGANLDDLVDMFGRSSDK